MTNLTPAQRIQAIKEQLKRDLAVKQLERAVRNPLPDFSSYVK